MFGKFEIPFPGEILKINEVSRSNLPGDFIELSNGFTHYQLQGSIEAPLVVLVHGFSTPNFIWDPTFDALLAAGYRVLRYDLFGRGYSDRPFHVYNRELFSRQLSELLKGLDIIGKFSLFGLSMGGIIAGDYAVNNPDRISHLGLFDPAGADAGPMPLMMKIGLIPGLGEILLSLLGNKRIEKFLVNDFFNIKDISSVIEQIRPQLKYKGYKRALLSTLRAGVLNEAKDIYQNIGEGDLPVLLLWGEEDKAVPFEQSESMIKLIPQTEFHPITGSGHIPHYDKPEIVNPILLEFLER